MEKNETDVEKLVRLIGDVKVAMMTTVDEGQLRSRPMATLRTPFDGSLWFFTSMSSHKAVEVRKESKVNMTYANPDKHIYVSVNGTAVLVHDRAKAEQLWNPLMKAWFPKGLDDPDLALLRVQVEQAEYWDSPSSPVITLAGFVKAMASGKRYEPSPGEHEKLKLP